jgi:glucose-1-phosphate thymidylyltransferase
VHACGIGHPLALLYLSTCAIILAGGSGSRLYPVTRATSKQLLPVYDKPMIYYPLSTVMLAGIRDVLVITTPRDQSAYQDLLQDGAQWGIRIQFAVQPTPAGLAQAFIIGKAFVAQRRCCLILGDNLFYGHTLASSLQKVADRSSGATIFAYRVAHPEHYGVVTFDASGNAITIEEKPSNPQSKYAIPGLYFYDHDVVEIAENLRPSARGELEITDINIEYLRRGQLTVEMLGRGNAWLDTGTPESLLQAGQFVQTVEQRQGLKISAPEEVAYRMRFIDRAQLVALAATMGASEYGAYLHQVAHE